MATRANQRLFTFESSGVAADTLQVTHFAGVEEVSHAFRFVVDLVSDDAEIDLDAVIGQPATFSLRGSEGDPVSINGVIADFRQGDPVSGRYTYNATLVPKLWLLSLSHQCRVFQNLRVDEIVSEVLKQAGFASESFRFALQATLPTREYCVQYRETDLDFIQRLLEHEGIYYFFEHSADGPEVVVFTDDRGESPDLEGTKRVEYHAGAGLVGRSDVAQVRVFAAERQVVTGKVILKDYNYRTPETQLLSTANLETTMPGVFYDYGAHFKDTKDGDRLARVRSEEFECNRRLFRGESDCVAMRAGHVFALAKHFRGDFNADYLLTRVEHEGSQGRAFGVGVDSSDAATYRNRFSGIPATTRFRPRRTTPVPRVAGIITARLETAGGDYAYIDDQGRYRVKLPFDLSDLGNGTASRAVRMAQPYSGANYGVHFTNRAGTEMVLACVDGDVDRPIGLSTVPNPSNASPAVAGNNAQCVIRTAGQNELTFDDTIGSENILLHGTKDWTIDITHDKGQTIGNNETTSVGVDQSLSVGSNQTITVGANRDKTVKANQSETVQGNKTINVVGNHGETIGANMSQTVGGAGAETIALAKALSIGAAYQVTVGAVMNESVGGAKMEEIGAAKVVNVGGGSSENVGANKSVVAGAGISQKATAGISSDAGKSITSKAGQDFAVSAGKKVGISAGDDVAISGGKNGVIDVKDQLVLKCGSASITMKKNGDIVIKGNKISVNGSGDVVIKGSKVLAN